jgi:hypothetical protein
MNHYPKRSKNMKKHEVVLGQVYAVKVSGRVQPVRLIAESPYGGWVGCNEQTGREIRIRTAAKLRSRLEKNGERWNLANHPPAPPIGQQSQQELTDQGVPY